MTWSIIGSDIQAGLRGIAASSAFLGVGGQIIYNNSQGTIVACQSIPSPKLAASLLDCSEDGLELGIPLTSDAIPTTCQVHYLTALGTAHGITGTACPPHNGCRIGNGVSVAGNTLASPEVINATFCSFVESNEPLDYRLVNALAAGQRAGGDRRGQQSAAIKIWDMKMRVVLDLRVDDYREALKALGALVDKAQYDYKQLVTMILSQG